jgi:ribosomal protein L16 Arg81 hydroxylase
MARKATTRRATPAIDESGLTKGEVRKLNALRKSLGDTIADKAFAEWFRQKTSTKAGAPVDQNAELIASTLLPLAKAGKLRMGRGGYLVKRGRGRVIVSRAGGT